MLPAVTRIQYGFEQFATGICCRFGIRIFSSTNFPRQPFHAVCPHFTFVPHVVDSEWQPCGKTQPETISCETDLKTAAFFAGDPGIPPDVQIERHLPSAVRMNEQWHI